jgi:hypothetical protein
MSILKRLFHRDSSGLPGKETYRRYRAAGKELNHKIMNASLEKEAVDYGVRKLGLGRRRQLIVDSEDDLSVLMEFAMYEHHRGGRNAVDRYREEIGGSSPMEQELLAAMVASSTSLFCVEEVSPKTCSLRLCDLIDGGSEITLMDVSFSQTAMAGVSFFVRPICLGAFCMTSGIAFTFPGGMEDDLLREWRRFAGRRPHNASAGRYAALFKLSKRRGIETIFT